MPASSDIVWRYSGGAANTSAAASLGGAMSTVAGGVIDEAVLHDLFDIVSGSESAAGDVEYRAIYVQNNHGTQTAFGAKLFIASPDNTRIDIALATEAVNVAIANTVADENTAPNGAWLAAAFSHPTTDGTGLSIGDIPATQFKGIWVRRTIPAAASATASESVGFNLAFDSD